MAKIYIIIKDNMTIGKFQNKEDRNKAFNEFILPNSDNCLIGEIDA